MRAFIQRVKKGSVKIDGCTKATIAQGIVVLLGVGKEDTVSDAVKLAHKTANLRIFEDENGKLNLSLKDIGGSALVVSQFTLYANCNRGNRPSFEQAAPPEMAQELYHQYFTLLAAEGIPVETGVFQADMLVTIENDGPVSILLESSLSIH